MLLKKSNYFEFITKLWAGNLQVQEFIEAQ